MSMQELIDNNMGLIYKAANSFYNAEKEDLIAAGKIGLLKAYQNYHNDGTTKFSTYAYKYIYGEMYTLACNNTNIKVNRYFLKLRKLAEKTRYELAQKYNRIPTNMELACYLEIDEDLINQATSNIDITKSLDDTENDERSIYETVGVDNPISVDDQIDINDSLESLNNAEREIIKARYYNDMTQTEVARKLKMTQVMVSRYEKKGIEKMRQYMLN